MSEKQYGPWFIECLLCGGRLIEWFGVSPPDTDDSREVAIAAGLLRHSSGIRVNMSEPARCDTCGKISPFDDGKGVFFMDPSRFRRTTT